MSKKAQIYFGLFANRSDVEDVMGDALPKRAEVEFAYRLGSWAGTGPARQYSEQCMVFYSMDRRLYGFNAERLGGGEWKIAIWPKINAARQLEMIPQYLEHRKMERDWAEFYLEVYRRMLALEELFDVSRIDGSEIDRAALPKIRRSLPGFAVEKARPN